MLNFPIPNVSPSVIDSAASLGPLLYYNSFVNNSAGVAGGAIASNSYTGFSILPTNLTANGTTVYTLFQSNYAPVGGALSLVNTNSDLSAALFINNTATSPTLAKSQGEPYACGAGQGGGICIVGDNQTTFNGESLIFVENLAVYGGGVSVHASPSCTPLQTQYGCFTVALDEGSQFVGNAAIDGAGGAIFWAHTGNLVVSCNGSKATPQRMSSAVDYPAVTDDVQPCSSWSGNTVSLAGYGPVIASTPFYLEPGTKSVSYYSSNAPLLLNVTMQVGSVCLNSAQGELKTMC